MTSLLQSTNPSNDINLWWAISTYLHLDTFWKYANLMDTSGQSFIGGQGKLPCSRELQKLICRNKCNEKDLGGSFSAENLQQSSLRLLWNGTSFVRVIRWLQAMVAEIPRLVKLYKLVVPDLCSRLKQATIEEEILLILLVWDSGVR